MESRTSRRHTSVLPGAINSPAQTPRAPRASLNLGPRQNTPGILRPPAFHSPKSTRRSRKSSLLDDRLDPHHVTLRQREELVRPPAVLALERLLEVANDPTGGPIRLHKEDTALFKAFESAKEVHISDATFLEPAELAQDPAYTQALSDPLSSLSLIIAISNLATFLHLILDSAPASTNHSRTPRLAKAAAARLRLAAHAFVPLIIPGTRPLAHALIKVLILLRQQAFLAETEASPGHAPDAQAYWTEPFEAFAAADRLGHRSSARWFAVCASTCLQTVESCGGRVEVLRGEWEWDAFAAEVVALANGVAPGLLDRLADTQEPASSLGEPSQEEVRQYGDQVVRQEDASSDDGQDAEGDVFGDDFETPRRLAGGRDATASPPITVDGADEYDQGGEYNVKAENLEGQYHSQQDGQNQSSYDDHDDATILAQLVGATPRAAGGTQPVDGLEETQETFDANTQAVTYAHDLNGMDDSDDGAHDSETEEQGAGQGDDGEDEDEPDRIEYDGNVSEATTQPSSSEEEEEEDGVEQDDNELVAAESDVEDEEETAPPVETQVVTLAADLAGLSDSEESEAEEVESQGDDESDDDESVTADTQAITMGTVFAGLSDSEDDDDELYQGEEQFNVETQVPTNAALLANLGSSDSEDEDELPAATHAETQAGVPLFAPESDSDVVPIDNGDLDSDEDQSNSESDATASSQPALPPRANPRSTRQKQDQAEPHSSPAPAPTARLRIQAGNRLAKVVEGANGGGQEDGQLKKRRFNATQPGAERVGWDSSSPSQEKRTARVSKLPPATAPAAVQVALPTRTTRSTKAGARQGGAELAVPRRTTRAGSRQAEERAQEADTEVARGRKIVAEEEGEAGELEPEVYTSEREDGALGPAEGDVEAEVAQLDVHNRDYGGGGDSEDGDGVPFGEAEVGGGEDVRLDGEDDAFEVDDGEQASPRPSGGKRQYGKKAARVRERHEARLEASQAAANRAALAAERLSASTTSPDHRSDAARPDPGQATTQSRGSTQVIQATQDAADQPEAGQPANDDRDSAFDPLSDSGSSSSSSESSESSDDGQVVRGLHSTATTSKAVPRPSQADQQRAARREEKERAARDNRRKQRRGGSGAGRVLDGGGEEPVREGREGKGKGKGKGRERDRPRVVDSEVDELESEVEEEAPARKKKKQKQQERLQARARTPEAESDLEPAPVASTSRSRKRLRLERDEDLSRSSDDLSASPVPHRLHNPYFQGRNGTNVRQGWTAEETACLVESLKDVGCAWGLIISRHGPGGTMSSKLKERTNVSVKDKARNLRIEYIKAKEEPPQWLSGVKAPPRWREIEEADRAERERRREARRRAKAAARAARREDKE